MATVLVNHDGLLVLNSNSVCVYVCVCVCVCVCERERERERERESLQDLIFDRNPILSEVFTYLCLLFCLA